MVDLATRTVTAAVLRPTTKSVDASLLLARTVTPEPMRPGWADALRMARSVLPCRRMLELDQRLAHAAARPVIVPETIVCDHGKAFISGNFRSSCRTLGITVQPAHPRTPTDKPHIERTLESVASLFAQFVSGYLGRSPEFRGRGAGSEPLWPLMELQDLLDEWLVARWQNRPHDGLRDPLTPGRALTPNEKYAALVEAAGYVPVALAAGDYIELLPAAWRAINAYGVKISHRIYDGEELNPFRRPALRRRGAGRAGGRSTTTPTTSPGSGSATTATAAGSPCSGQHLSHRAGAVRRAGLGPRPGHAGRAAARIRPPRPRSPGAVRALLDRAAPGPRQARPSGPQAAPRKTAGSPPAPGPRAAAGLAPAGPRPAPGGGPDDAAAAGRAGRDERGRARRGGPAGGLRRPGGGRRNGGEPRAAAGGLAAGAAEPTDDPERMAAVRRTRRPRRFDLLPDAAVGRRCGRASSAAYDEARISYHSELVVVATSTVAEITRQGRLLTLLNRREIGARRGLIVSGPSATGKSTALKQLGRTHELMVRERYPGHATGSRSSTSPRPPKGSPRKLAMEFARFLGLPPVGRGHNTTDIADAVCQVLIDARTDLVLVDEIHNLNLATSAGEDLSDHLKYFTEHLPATFVYAGIDVERSGLFTGVRGRQIAGRCVLITTGPFPCHAEWTGLVATMEATLRLHRHQPGTLTGLDKYLHQRTGGMIGSLSHLVRAAAHHRHPGRHRGNHPHAARRRSRSTTPRSPARTGAA